MAVVEGRGVVPPGLVSIAISSADIRFLEQVAKDRDRHRNYGNATSAWKRGSTSNPILMGLVGEYAFQEFLKSRGVKSFVVDDALNNGDGGKDAIIGGVSYQIKTSGKSYRSCLIRRVNESKRIVAHTSDRFVFCRWSYGDKHCDIRGWCERESIVELGKFCKGKRGGWFNNEIEDIHFNSMANLAMLIKQEITNG